MSVHSDLPERCVLLFEWHILKGHTMLMCTITPFNSLGKGHVSFPQVASQAHSRDIATKGVRPQLTLAVPAAVTLPAPLLVHHCVAPALRAQVARHTQVAQTQYACSRSSGDG